MYDELILIYPELEGRLDLFRDGTISIQNDSDGAGDYLISWNYDKPLPKGFKIGK